MDSHHRDGSLKGTVRMRRWWLSGLAILAGGLLAVWAGRPRAEGPLKVGVKGGPVSLIGDFVLAFSRQPPLVGQLRVDVSGPGEFSVRLQNLRAPERYNDWANLEGFTALVSKGKLLCPDLFDERWRSWDLSKPVRPRMPLSRPFPPPFDEAAFDFRYVAPTARGLLLLADPGNWRTERKSDLIVVNLTEPAKIGEGLVIGSMHVLRPNPSKPPLRVVLLDPQGRKKVTVTYGDLVEAGGAWVPLSMEAKYEPRQIEVEREVKLVGKVKTTVSVPGLVVRRRFRLQGGMLLPSETVVETQQGRPLLEIRYRVAEGLYRR